MADMDVVELKDSNFEQEVLKSDVPVLVDFTAAWCAPCRAIGPVVAALATQYKGKVKVGKMDADTNQDTCGQYGIRSLPTLLMFKGGKVVEQVVGAVPKTRLEGVITKSLGVTPPGPLDLGWADPSFMTDLPRDGRTVLFRTR